MVLKHIDYEKRRASNLWRVKVEITKNMHDHLSPYAGQLLAKELDRLSLCPECGSLVLGAARGMQKKWCSDACRTYYKTHRGEGDPCAEN